MEAQSVGQKRKKFIYTEIKHVFQKPPVSTFWKMSHSTTIACKNSKVQMVLLDANGVMKKTPLTIIEFLQITLQKHDLSENTKKFMSKV